MSGSNLVMGVTSDAQRRRTISSWKSVYSSSLSWTRRSRRNDYLLMASKRCWCSALLKWWLSYSGAELVPLAALSFLDIFEASFLGTISCKNKHLEVSFTR
ncbi:hypothetical protein HKD37_05G013159 [Glycine soja]